MIGTQRTLQFVWKLQAGSLDWLHPSHGSLRTNLQNSSSAQAISTKRFQQNGFSMKNILAFQRACVVNSMRLQGGHALSQSDLLKPGIWADPPILIELRLFLGLQELTQAFLSRLLRLPTACMSCPNRTNSFRDSLLIFKMLPEWLCQP